MFKIVEKKDIHAVHAICDSLEEAENHLANVIPEYVGRGYYMDKTLKADDFMVVRRK